MNLMVKEIYEAFKDAGADEDKAMAAAQAVPAAETLATKADIAEVKGEIAEVRGEIAEVRGEIAGLRGEVGRDLGLVYWHIWLMGTGLFATMMGLRLFD